MLRRGFGPIHEFGDVVMVVVPYTGLEQIGKEYGNALAKVFVIDGGRQTLSRQCESRANLVIFECAS
jgi:hypothetical protein